MWCPFKRVEGAGIRRRLLQFITKFHYSLQIRCLFHGTLESNFHYPSALSLSSNRDDNKFDRFDIITHFLPFYMRLSDFYLSPLEVKQNKGSDDKQLLTSTICINFVAVQSISFMPKYHPPQVDESASS